jgi:2',3'-cyclic-nucleotide 2'-phosphodiesterase (5'-nucleotidase family)
MGFLAVLGLCAGALGALTELSGCLIQGEAVDLTGNDVPLTLLHTSDWHSRLVPYTYDPPAPVEQLGLRLENAPFGGVTRFATVIKQERAKAFRSLWLDTGDCFQGAPIFNVFSGEAEIRSMSELNIDAAVIGNHEFDLGVNNFVEQYTQWGNYAALAANYDPEDFNVIGNKRLGEVMSPYRIFNVHGLKVLVIGMANFSSLNSIGEGGNSIGVTPMEQNSTVQMYIDLLAPAVDVVGVISHMGMEWDFHLIDGYKRYIPVGENPPRDQECRLIEQENTYECDVPGVRGLDFVLGGHNHIALNPPRPVVDRDGREVPVIHSGAFMQFLGRADMVFRHASRMNRHDWYGFELVDHRFKLLPIDNTVDDDLETTRLMEPYFFDLALNYDLQRPIAFTATGITRTSPTGGDSALGNIVAGSIRTRNRVETDFSLTNSAGIRDNIPPGPITAEMLFNVFPFENTITTFFLSGGEVKEVFDYVASRSKGRGCRSQVQVDGVSFKIRCDCNQTTDGCCGEARGFGEFPPACADDILIDGNPLNPNGSYEVGANDYMARGGSGKIPQMHAGRSHRHGHLRHRERSQFAGLPIPIH